MKLFQPATSRQSYMMWIVRTTKARGYWFRYLGDQLQVQVPDADADLFEQYLWKGKNPPEDFKLAIGVWTK